MMALFPPNSSNDLPQRPVTAYATSPIRVEPVAEIKGTRLSLVIISHFIITID
jgi:hypothetical protein